MNVEVNAAEAMVESCGNNIRQVLNSLQMWSCKRRATGSRSGGSNGGGNSMTYRDVKERMGEINKDEVVEGRRGQGIGRGSDGGGSEEEGSG